MGVLHFLSIKFDAKIFLSPTLANRHKTTWSLQEMSIDFRFTNPLLLHNAPIYKLPTVRNLHSSQSLSLRSVSHGAYEMQQCTMVSDASRVAVNIGIKDVKTRRSSQARILPRLKAMREIGTLQERPANQKLQICLVASKKIDEVDGPLLTEKHGPSK